MNDFNDNNELDGIFDNLTPEDFLQVESTAVGISSLAAHDDDFVGDKAFARFLARSIDAIRVSWAAGQSEINPIAIMVTAHKQYVYTPDDSETLGQFTDRLRAETERLGVLWVFICRKTMVGAAVEEDAGSAVGDADVFDRAAMRGRMRPGILFYAQRREPGVLDNFHGYLHGTSATQLGEIVMGEQGQPVPDFHILG